jgi:hypothetical protein
MAQTDFRKLQFSLMPNVGISLFGTLGVYYGYVLNPYNRPFDGSTEYQAGFKYNFTRNLYKTFKEGI